MCRRFHAALTGSFGGKPFFLVSVDNDRFQNCMNKKEKTAKELNPFPLDQEAST